MKARYTQQDVDARSRELIGAKLRNLIETFDGSDGQAKEILRGLVAAEQLGIDLRDFSADLKKLRVALDAA